MSLPFFLVKLYPLPIFSRGMFVFFFLYIFFFNLPSHQIGIMMTSEKTHLEIIWFDTFGFASIHFAEGLDLKKKLIKLTIILKWNIE